MSWAIVCRQCGRAVLETFDRQTADAINRAAYDVLPISTYLGGMNASIGAINVETEFEKLVRYIRQVRINSGSSQAECVADSYGAQFGHDKHALLDASRKAGDGWYWG